MGLTVTFVIAPEELSDLQLTGLAELGPARRLGTRSGWTFYRSPFTIAPVQFERRMANLSANLDGPLLAYFIHDDDWAFLVAADRGEVAAQALINPLSADGYIGARELKTLIEATKHAGADLAEWAKRAPKTAASKDIADLLAQAWDFAGEGAARILDQFDLGFPSPEQELQVFEEMLELEASSTVTLGSQSFHTRHSKFIRGVGLDFIGIWDRRLGGPPLARFSMTKEGYMASSRKWKEFEMEPPKASGLGTSETPEAF